MIMKQNLSLSETSALSDFRVDSWMFILNRLSSDIIDMNITVMS